MKESKKEGKEEKARLLISSLLQMLSILYCLRAPYRFDVVTKRGSSTKRFEKCTFEFTHLKLTYFAINKNAIVSFSFFLKLKTVF